MTKLKPKVLCTCTIMLLALASMVAGQVVYDSVRVKVASGTTCPSGWTASQSESVTTPTRHIVQVPVSIGGRAFRVTSGFVNAVWPSSTDKAGGGRVGGAGDPSWLGLDDQLLLPTPMTTWSRSRSRSSRSRSRSQVVEEQVEEPGRRGAGRGAGQHAVVQGGDPCRNLPRS